MAWTLEEHRIRIAPESQVSAIWIAPKGADAVFVYAHGAGAPMRHVFMAATANALAERRIATLRYNFPYTEAGRRRPDGKAVLLDTIRAAARHAREHTPLPIFAGGKSMGGRLSSHAGLDELGVQGLIFVGFPLHRPKEVSRARAAHLPEVELPMLFLQGTRDALADLEAIRSVCGELPQATLHIVEGADHGFHVLKRSGRTDAEVIAELADTTREWLDRRLADR